MKIQELIKQEEATRFDEKRGIVGKVVEWEETDLSKNFWEFILGQKRVEQPKVERVNILK